MYGTSGLICENATMGFSRVVQVSGPLAATGNSEPWSTTCGIGRARLAMARQNSECGPWTLHTPGFGIVRASTLPLSREALPGSSCESLISGAVGSRLPGMCFSLLGCWKFTFLLSGPEGTWQTQTRSLARIVDAGFSPSIVPAKKKRS